MSRDELGALLRLLVDAGRITAAQAAEMVRLFDIGELATAQLPVKLADLPGRLTPQELAVAMRDVAVRLTPKQAAPFLAAATKPVTTQTPPEVKRFLRERLRNHFRQDYDNAVAGYTHALANGGNVAGWHKRMQLEQRAYIARMTTAGLGRPLAASEIDNVSRLAVQQQAYLYRFAGEISARRAAGMPHSEAYLQARIRQYGGVGWAEWFKANETVEARGDGYVARYISVDSPNTCGPCLDAQNNSPYLPHAGPFPGDVCRGRGLCKCRREVVFDMEAWTALGGVSSGPAEQPKPPKVRKPRTPKPKAVAQVEYVRPSLFDEFDNLRDPRSWETFTALSAEHDDNVALIVQEYRERAREYIQNNQLLSRTVKTHGMVAKRRMKSFDLAGVTVYYDAQSEAAAVDSLLKLYADEREGRRMPRKLWEANKNIYFVAERNKDDAFWEKKYNMAKFESAATGGDGDIMVYRGQPASSREIAHESGHNLATKLYGKTVPKAGSDYAAAIADPNEQPVTAYARNSASEDFAETANYYVTHQAELRANHPRRFSVFDQILKGASRG